MTDEAKKKRKKSANYALEVLLEQKADDTSQPLWREIRDEFISPKSALEFAKEQKVQGVVRVVRIASGVFGGSVVTPEPIYTLSKISGVTTPEKRKRRTRKVAAPAAATAAPAAPAAPPATPPPDPAVVEATTPPPDVEAIPAEPSDADLDAMQ